MQNDLLNYQNLLDIHVYLLDIHVYSIKTFEMFVISAKMALFSAKIACHCNEMNHSHQSTNQVTCKNEQTVNFQFA